MTAVALQAPDLDPLESFSAEEEAFMRSLGWQEASVEDDAQGECHGPAMLPVSSLILGHAVTCRWLQAEQPPSLAIIVPDCGASGGLARPSPTCLSNIGLQVGALT